MDYLQTALEAALVVAVFISLDYFFGLGVASILVPEEWRKHALLMPLLLGWCVLVLALVFVNAFVGVQYGLYPLMAAALGLNVFAVFKRKVRIGDWRAAMIPILLALGLVVLALLPHILQRSLGLVVLNQDEEEYYPVANFLLLFPGRADAHLWAGAFIKFLPWGWGVPYLIASVSAITGMSTFLTYAPVNYLLLGLSVPAWYLFFVETLELPRREAVVALCFYSLLGLPLWFAAYGYGTQMSSLVTVPLGVAAFTTALERGGLRRMILAGIVVSAGLVCFYRGIALQYVFLFIPVGLVVLATKRSLKPVARGLAILLIAVASGFPAHLGAGNWFLRPGGLSSQSLDISGGWNLDYFQPAGVMLGLQSFPIAVDDANVGPLADFGFPSATAADTLAWILLAAALFGLVRVSKRRPVALAVVVGTALSLGFNRIVLNYPYGWVKLMPISAPLVYALAVGSANDLVRLARGLWGRWAM
ncbi:MAG TPA: hypothetical protein VF960_02450, partial [Chloroflexota bacterium]